MAGKSKKKRGTSSKTKKKNTGQSFVGDEILIWASLAVSLLLLWATGWPRFFLLPLDG